MTRKLIDCMYISRASDNLVVVNVNDRAAIDLPSMNDVVNCTNDRNTSKHDDTIVHVSNERVVEKREEADDGLHEAVEERDDVDWDTLCDGWSACEVQ